MVWYSTPPASRPAPRLTARSMLSLGTEVFFAFWMASYSVGLPLTSPPPVRAATSMFLISLAKDLPRRASMTAFLCLVVAHLEWPLMAEPSRLTFLHDPDEQLVHPSVTRHLGVERRGQQRALANGDDPTRGLPLLHPGEHRDRRPDVLDPGRPDEHPVQRAARDARHLDIAFEGRHLPAEGVPPHRHVDPAERLLVGRTVQHPVREQDHARTRAVRREPLPQRGTERVAQPEGPHQLVHRGRLAPGPHDPVQAVELAPPAYGATSRTDPLQRGEVLADVALEGEHADGR